LAKFASVFEAIDDPGLYERAGLSKHVHERQIVILKGDHGYALVEVEKVLAGPECGDAYTEATVSWEIRTIDDEKAVGQQR
jgi:hypothetical protein